MTSASWPWSSYFDFSGLGSGIVALIWSSRLILALWSGFSESGFLGWLPWLRLIGLTFLDLAFRTVLLDSRAALGSGSLRISWPWSFGDGAWPLALWSWIPDCELTSPGFRSLFLFELDCSISGFLS